MILILNCLFSMLSKDTKHDLFFLLVMLFKFQDQKEKTKSEREKINKKEPQTNDVSNWSDKRGELGINQKHVNAYMKNYFIEFCLSRLVYVKSYQICF